VLDDAGSICVPSCHSLYDVIVMRSARAWIAIFHIESYVAPLRRGFTTGSPLPRRAS
jgi:hypothetical protein